MHIMAVVHAKIKARRIFFQKHATEWRILLWKSPWEHNEKHQKKPARLNRMAVPNMKPATHAAHTPTHGAVADPHRPPVFERLITSHAFLYIYFFFEEQCDVTCTVLQKVAVWQDVCSGMIACACSMSERLVECECDCFRLQFDWLERVERTQITTWTSNQQRANQQHYTNFSRKCADSNWLWLWGMIKIK